VQFGIANYWGNSYWGGALPAAGGAIVVGSLPRFARREQGSTALLAAIGASVLAITRPYEGLILTLASFLILIWWRRSKRRPIRLLLARGIILPATVVFYLTFAWLGYYNYRVTGKPWLMPYSVNQSTYAANSVFWILPRGPVPKYRHQVVRTFWEINLTSYEQVREKPLRILTSFWEIMRFFLPPPFLLAAFIAVLFVPTRKVINAVVICTLVAVGLLLEVSLHPHYYAPATCLILFLALVGARYLINVGLKHPRFADLALLLVGALMVFELTIKALEVKQRPQEDFGVQRHMIMERLAQNGSRHLVVVRYSTQHKVGEEWVYNRANIDEADVVWARDMGEDGNRPLVEYYKDRKIWLIQPDVDPGTLMEYASAMRNNGTLQNGQRGASVSTR